ncbi:hypothetical protein PhCBS80983_g05535 [Powellomyces hirtus]|uniref:Rab-GAP TBC domain-containing protein n=1 Tax=Powellomyces hirtus TaxID=109895 RepID=A0A507DVF1_9FUNG|nr:hypothetical protein PhCBS80983_g05535 [Powellomyces hirtus]
MFIKPLDTTVLPAATFQDRAGNAHFALQSKRQNAVQSLFSGLASLSLAVSPDATYKRSLMEYEFRIILRCPSRKRDYIVAVDESFEKIHTDWNWVEQNLFLKLEEMDLSKSKVTPEQIDNLLVKQFDELTEEAVDPRAAEVQAKLQQVLQEIQPVFPALAGEVLLNFYACTYWINDQLSARGQLCITRNYVCFQGVKAPGSTDGDAKEAQNVRFILALKDIMSIDLVDANRVLLPDSIQISTKTKNYTFSLYFHRKEVFRVLCVLSNAAMHRLIKGAENSMSALADMFGKGNVSGDLSANVGSRGGGILTMGRSRDEFSFFPGRSASVVSDALDETDFTEQRFDRSVEISTPVLEANTLPDDPLDGTDNGVSNADAEKQFEERNHNLVRYAHISAATIHTIEELDMQLKNFEFRQLFRLPFADTVILEEMPCYYYHKAASNNFTGKLVLSQNFFNFVGLSPANANAQSHPTSTNTVTMSMLFDSPQDPTLLMVIPYPHIVSVKKQPPTALPAAGKLSSFSLSGYLVLSTKSKQEMWLSFSNVKSRDRVSDVLLQRMKQVDFHFDDEYVIGERNATGPRTQPANVASAGASPSTSLTPTMLSSPVYKGAGSVTSTGSLDEYTRPQEDPLSSGGAASAPRILEVGLRALFDDVDSESSLPHTLRLRPGSQDFEGDLLKRAVIGATTIDTRDRRKEEETAAVDAWNGFFEANGRDVCMIKDLKALRELMLKTGGIPPQYRGDVWMICVGGWYSRPEKNYYVNLVQEHLEETSVFAEEIEKDVRRSLPEHPAYQSPIGIDALRRVLTAYSWRNPAIGYAQALNILSAVLLLHLREEDAFWMLCIIVERILPDHYTKTLVGSVVDQSVFSRLVEMHMPALWTHLTKLYMDLSTISVPWFMCLFLNTVPLRLGVKFLDAFFVDGPKFLFWVALAILKINEQQLVTRGRDDDIFMQIIKNFFQRLGATGDDAVPGNVSEDGDGEEERPMAQVARTSQENLTRRFGVGLAVEPAPDPNTLTGRPLFEHLMTVAYATFAGSVTSEVIDALRMRYRLTVVHQMEDTSRKSQIRTLCEQVSLAFEEVAIVYDEVRRLEFAHEEEVEDPKGPAATARAEERVEEDNMRDVLISFGGWGMASNARGGGGGGAGGGGSGFLPRRQSRRNPQRTKLQKQQEVGQKTVCLADFRKVFGVVSPWRSGATTGPNTNAANPASLSPRRPSTAAQRPPLPKGKASAPNTTTAPTAVPPSLEDFNLGLTDRIYFYCSLHYNFLRTAKRGADASSPLAPAGYQNADTNGAGGGDANGRSGSADKTTYIVDLATMVHVLDIIMRQPLHSRLRFLFEIHDIDGDGFLDKNELKAVMDSLLEMFERARTGSQPSATTMAGATAANTPSATVAANLAPATVSTREDEEMYLGAVSSFLNTALKLGNNKPDTGTSTAGPGSGPAGSSLRRSASSDFANVVTQASAAAVLSSTGNNRPPITHVPHSTPSRQLPHRPAPAKHHLPHSQHQYTPRLDAALGEDMESEEGELGGSATPPATTSTRAKAHIKALRTHVRSSNPTPSRSRPQSAGSPRTSSVIPPQPPSSTSGTPPLDDNHNNGSNSAFRLSFNEFLLAVLSQSVFVQYFERVWTLCRHETGSDDPSGDGPVVVQYLAKAK